MAETVKVPVRFLPRKLGKGLDYSDQGILAFRSEGTPKDDAAWQVLNNPVRTTLNQGPGIIQS